MARPNRVKLTGEGYYHVIDRVAHREFLLNLTVAVENV
jgi:hypothetical protein